MRETDMKLKTLIVASTISLLASFPSQADNIELGLLTCDIEGGVGFLIGSKKDLTCVFEYAKSKRPDDLYTGTVKKFGLDVGVTGRAVVKWVVLGANVDSAAPGSLGGDYVGVSATASAGVGIGANALIGGSNDGFILQPFSIEGSEGMNVAIGFSKFSLTAVN
jgi:hypothetical protein